MTDHVDSQTKARRKYESTGRGKTIIKVNLAASDDPQAWDALKEHLTNEYGSVKAGIMAMYNGQSAAEPNLLANKVLNFLLVHAEMNADFDPAFDDEEDMFGSPDASNLYMLAKQLIETGALTSNSIVDSSWESGGYRPYSSKEARAKHDSLVGQLKEWMRK
ncbi:MAG: hypothetical protein GY833_21980 [Aestuariibacter sp.]|nr:hypothetical protein [Aestuariibacter sp.]